MALISIIKNHIWPSYGQNGSHAHIWANVFGNFWANWAEIYYGSSRDHYLSMLIFQLLIFRATFGGKMGVSTTRAPNGLGPPNSTKKLAQWVDPLGQPLSRNHVFEIFRGEPLLNMSILHSKNLKKIILFAFFSVRDFCKVHVT